MKQLVLLLWIHFLQLAKIDSQQIGVDLCACQPQEYEISLDYSLTCNGSTVQPNEQRGIQAFACTIETLEDVVSQPNPVPVFINQVQVLELDRSRQVVSQMVFRVPFLQKGDRLWFASSIDRAERHDFTADSLPSGLQILIRGVGADGIPILSSFLVEFTNSCDHYPVLRAGDTAGWVRFVSDDSSLLQFSFSSNSAADEQHRLVSPPSSLCPLANDKSIHTLEPTPAPTDHVTEYPHVWFVRHDPNERTCSFLHLLCYLFKVFGAAASDEYNRACGYFFICGGERR